METPAAAVILTPTLCLRCLCDEPLSDTPGKVLPNLSLTSRFFPAKLKLNLSIFPTGHAKAMTAALFACCCQVIPYKMTDCLSASHNFIPMTTSYYVIVSQPCCVQAAPVKRFRAWKPPQ